MPKPSANGKIITLPNHWPPSCCCRTSSLKDPFGNVLAERSICQTFLKIGGGYCVRSSDLIDRCGNEVYDFLCMDNQHWDGDIITNPPYKYALDFVCKALSIVPDGRKVCMFLKVQFLEGKARKELFVNHPPKVLYVSSSRLLCAPNGDFEATRKNGGSAVAYAWFVWEKGYKGDTIIKWIN